MNRDSIIIEADELKSKLGDPNLRIFDAQINFFPKEGEPTAHEAYQSKHIPGAVFFNHDLVSVDGATYTFTVLPEAELAKAIGDMGISNDNEVIVYSSGMLATATRAFWVLRYAGHNNVRILNGGLTAWGKSGGEVESGDNTYAPATFTPRLRSEMFVGLDEVKSAQDDDTVNTSYALPVGMYENQMIPNSVCIPMTQFTTEDWITLLPDDQLVVSLQADKDAERVITYCGGGIAATINAVAHLIAGNENVAVYDGSLSEWIGEGMPTIVGETD